MINKVNRTNGIVLTITSVVCLIILIAIGYNLYDSYVDNIKNQDSKSKYIPSTSQKDWQRINYEVYEKSLTPVDKNFKPATLYKVTDLETNNIFPFITQPGGKPEVTDWNIKLEYLSTDTYWSPGACASKPSIFLEKFIVTQDGVDKDNKAYYSIYDIHNQKFIYIRGLSLNYFHIAGKNRFSVIIYENQKLIKRIIDLESLSKYDILLFEGYINTYKIGASELLEIDYKINKSTQEFVYKIYWSQIPDDKFKDTKTSNYFKYNLSKAIVSISQEAYEEFTQALDSNNNYNTDKTEEQLSHNGKSLSINKGKINLNEINLKDEESSGKLLSQFEEKYLFAGIYQSQMKTNGLKYNNMIKYNIKTKKYDRIFKDNGTEFLFFNKY